MVARSRRDLFGARVKPRGGEEEGGGGEGREGGGMGDVSPGGGC